MVNYSSNVNFIYDVAISFLSQDEPLATELYNSLSENLKIFVYSKKQEHIAGRDGLEAFRQAFFSQSRVQVVLYREGWGKTRWTAIEDLAIRERMFEGNWKSLLFVSLDAHCSLPEWLPQTHVRLDYQRFGFDALVGIIKHKAIETGSELQVETASGKARRMALIAAARNDRAKKLTYLTPDVVTGEWKKICELLGKQTTEIQSIFPMAAIEYGAADDRFAARTTLVSLDVRLRSSWRASESQIIAETYIGLVILPQQTNRMYVPGHGPELQSSLEFAVDYSSVAGWCWRPDASQEELMTLDALSDLLLKKLMEIHEQVESGEVTRRPKSVAQRRQSRYSRTSWR